MKSVTIYTDGGAARRAPGTGAGDVPIGSRLAPEPPRDDKARAVGSEAL